MAGCKGRSGRKVDPNSENQLIKKMLFKDSDLPYRSNLPRKWPEPQRTIYYNLFRNNMTICPKAVIKQAKKLSALLAANNLG